MHYIPKTIHQIWYQGEDNVPQNTVIMHQRGEITIKIMNICYGTKMI